jgi:diaminopimelate epimerase
MRLKVVKMHGQGNDYIFFDLENTHLPNVSWHDVATRLSDRHRSLGADGIVLIHDYSYICEKHNKNDRKTPNIYSVYMRIFNADGSEAETCGTALRCVALYLHKKHRQSDFLIYTLSGKRHCAIDKNQVVSVEMGKAVITGEANIAIGKHSIFGYNVHIGNPHFCVFQNHMSNDIPTTTIPKSLYKKIEDHHSFTQRTNVENIAILSPDEIKVRVWERGSGFTLACGSGACATAYLSKKIMNIESKLKVHLPGGTVLVEMAPDGLCTLIGEVEIAYQTMINIS